MWPPQHVAYLQWLSNCTVHGLHAQCRKENIKKIIGLSDGIMIKYFPENRFWNKYPRNWYVKGNVLLTIDQKHYLHFKGNLPTEIFRILGGKCQKLLGIFWNWLSHTNIMPRWKLLGKQIIQWIETTCVHTQFLAIAYGSRRTPYIISISKCTLILLIAV